MPKSVASSTMKWRTWVETTIWKGEVVSATKALKAESDGEALIYGSASVVHQLASADLIDEYRLMVYPTILGAGKRLYSDGAASQLQLAECKQFGGGIVLLRYTAG